MLEQAARCVRPGWIEGLAALFNVADHAALVDHERRPVGEPFLLVQDAVLFRHRSLKIAEERKGEAVLLGEDLVRR